MRRRVLWGFLIVQPLLLGVAAAPSAASAVSGPHETIDNVLSTTQPNSPTGFSFSATYHAAGDPSAYPPYMRRMTAYNPDGLRWDTSVPAACTASDLELATLGAAACPAGSRLGGGSATASVMGSAPTTTQLDFFNNTNGQIILLRSPLIATVARGKIFPDGSVEFASPTCFPYVNPPGCATDNVLQLASSITVAPYTKNVDGIMRSYMTTPATCPSTGHWSDPITLWWADGTVDTVVLAEPCT
jgi:hypothetical protein